MVQGRGGASLELEAAQAITVAGDLSEEDLDRHLAPQPRILRPIHLPHPPRADRREDLVRAEARPGGKRHFSPSTSWREERVRKWL